MAHGRELRDVAEDEAELLAVANRGRIQSGAYDDIGPCGHSGIDLGRGEYGARGDQQLWKLRPQQADGLSGRRGAEGDFGCGEPCRDQGSTQRNRLRGLMQGDDR